jgi:hypothetical protein
MKWKEWEVVANNETLWHDQEEKGLLKAEYLGDYKLRKYGKKLKVAEPAMPAYRSP